jgi:hypothetical protein
LVVLAIYLPMLWIFLHFRWYWLLVWPLIFSLCFLYFKILEKRAISIVCPECQKYIETTTPWICGNKDMPHRNDQVGEFPFINQCQHCGFIPKAYQCHHCGELIFFTRDHLKSGYARCADKTEEPKSRPPVEKDKVVKKINELDKGIQLTEREVKKAELDLKLKVIKQDLEPPKEMTEREKLEESASRFKDRFTTGPKIVEQWKAENAQRFKDNPVELEKANLLVDQWVRNNLDRM